MTAENFLAMLEERYMLTALEDWAVAHDAHGQIGDCLMGVACGILPSSAWEELLEEIVEWHARNGSPYLRQSVSPARFG